MSWIYVFSASLFLFFLWTRNLKPKSDSGGTSLSDFLHDVVNGFTEIVIKRPASDRVEDVYRYLVVI